MSGIDEASTRRTRIPAPTWSHTQSVNRGFPSRTPFPPPEQAARTAPAGNLPSNWAQQPQTPEQEILPGPSLHSSMPAVQLPSFPPPPIHRCPLRACPGPFGPITGEAHCFHKHFLSSETLYPSPRRPKRLNIDHRVAIRRRTYPTACRLPQQTSSRSPKSHDRIFAAPITTTSLRPFAMTQPSTYSYHDFKQ